MTEDKKERLWLKTMECGARCGCHQRADRSFFLGRWQFPVCARCTGVFIGQTLALFTVKKRISPWAALCCCEVMLADWVLQALGLKESTNPRRLVTGIAGGFGTAVLYFSAIRRAVGYLRKKIPYRE